MIASGALRTAGRAILGAFSGIVLGFIAPAIVLGFILKDTDPNRGRYLIATTLIGAGLGAIIASVFGTRKIQGQVGSAIQGMLGGAILGILIGSTLGHMGGKMFAAAGVVLGCSVGATLWGIIGVTCSPQAGPSVMRVILARQGRRTFDEAHPTLARADHPQAV